LIANMKKIAARFGKSVEIRKIAARFG